MYCLKTSNLKENSHEINRIVALNGEISSLKCSCKAGLGEQYEFVTLNYLVTSHLCCFSIKYKVIKRTLNICHFLKLNNCILNVTIIF